VLTLNLAGRESYDEEGDFDNEIGTLNSAIAGDVVAVAFDGVDLNTVGDSWCIDASITLSTTDGGAGVFAAFSTQGSSGPCGDLPFSEYFDLVEMNLEFPTGPGNTVFWELWEDFDDDPGGLDAIYSAGTVTVYVCPTGQALPLELKSFAGRNERTYNLLEWVTLTERNVATHIVERSANGSTDWQELGRVASKGDSQSEAAYQFEDRNPLSQAYYRLRSVDFDGQENRSNIVRLERKGEGYGISTLFPSPTTADLTVQFNTNEEQSLRLRVTDVAGRLVLEQQLDAAKGFNSSSLNVAALQAGVYFVSLDNGTALSEPMRFVKQ
jgi:hypothetical protein